MWRPDAIAIADGGDILSFARMGLEPRTYLDAGAFGCLGVGVPYGVAAALLQAGLKRVNFYELALTFLLEAKAPVTARTD